MTKNRVHTPVFLSFQNWCYEEGYKFVDETEEDVAESAAFKYQGRSMTLWVEQEDETVFLNIHTGTLYEENILPSIWALNELNGKMKSIKLYIDNEECNILGAEYHSFLEKGQLLSSVVIGRIIAVLYDVLLDAEIAVEEALEEAKKSE